MMMEQKGFLRELALKRQEVADFSSYPYNIPAVRDLETLALHPKVTYFVGENGCGKSTFVEAIALLAGFNAEGGSKHFSHSFFPTESSLYQHIKLVRGIRREKTGFFLRSETMFNVSSVIETDGLFEYGWQSLHSRSHGEAFM